jgi:GrpB-like predicted nucleotidyltransferase (UPF0157 family)
MDRLSRAEVPIVAIHHIGSTSIPNLTAKNNIDMALVVVDDDIAKAASKVLTSDCSSERYESCGDGGIRGRYSSGT